MIRAGKRAPDFTLARLGGGEVSLADLLAGGPVLLAFFKISCPVCQLLVPHLERIHQAGTLPIYGVSQNLAGATEEFNRAFGVSFPVLLDPEYRFPASNAFGITHVPTLFLVEADGVVAQVIDGWDREAIRRLGARAGADPFLPGQSVPAWKAG
jgi:peroxiredoxin